MAGELGTNCINQLGISLLKAATSPARASLAVRDTLSRIIGSYSRRTTERQNLQYEYTHNMRLPIPGAPVD